MQVSANHIYFFISYAVAFLAFGLIGKWYVWPNIKDRAPKVALTPLGSPVTAKPTLLLNPC